MIVPALMLAAQTAGAAPEITPAIRIVEEPDGFRAEAPPFAERDQAVVPAAIEAAAVARCGGAPVQWGRFAFDTKVTPAGTGGGSLARVGGYRHSFRCGAADGSASAAGPEAAAVASDWQADAAEEQAARRLFDLF